LETLKRYQTGGGSPASSRCGPSIAATPRNKGPDLRQHRQHRLHDPCLFSDPSQDSLIGSRPMTGGSTDDADGTDGAFVLTLIILVPVRPPRENVLSTPSVRRNVCARRNRPASARGFFAHAVPLEMSARARSAHKRKRSDALPVHMVRSGCLRPSNQIAVTQPEALPAGIETS
jgi:hypothetical protein